MTRNDLGNTRIPVADRTARVVARTECRSIRRRRQDVLGERAGLPDVLAGHPHGLAVGGCSAVVTPSRPECSGTDGQVLGEAVLRARTVGGVLHVTRSVLRVEPGVAGAREVTRTRDREVQHALTVLRSGDGRICQIGAVLHEQSLIGQGCARAVRIQDVPGDAVCGTLTLYLAGVRNPTSAGTYFVHAHLRSMAFTAQLAVHA